jgi:hypothetical protein
MGVIALEFHAPDAGEGKTPYTCSFHWFRLPDGRICGLDVIRSEDSGQLGLRAFVVEESGEFRHLVRVAPAAEWKPFHTEERPDALHTDANVLGRGAGWVAGHARGDGAPGSIGDFRFELAITPETPGLGTGQHGLAFLNLTIADFRRVRTCGTVIIDGERFAVDALGPCSLHYGSSLPPYAYLATVPRSEDAAPSLLLAAAAGDDLRVGGKLLAELCVTYAYGEHGVPAVSLHIGSYEQTIQLGGGRHIELRDAKLFPHQLLARSTVTGTALARLVDSDGSQLELGRVVFDYRGDPIVAHVP